MAVVPKDAKPNFPYLRDPLMFNGDPVGQVSIGDFLMFSGSNVIRASANVVAHVKSAAGIALDANPVADQHGTTRKQSAIRVLRQGILRVPAHSAGRIPLGYAAFPVNVGNSANFPTGVTGRMASWSASDRYAYSAAATNAERFGIGTVVNYIGDNSSSGMIDVIVNLDSDGYF